MRLPRRTPADRLMAPDHRGIHAGKKHEWHRMTWHFFDGDNIECPSCSAKFIPFEEEQPCPRCGTPSTEHFRFLDDVVVAMRAHKGQYGCYTAPAFFVGGPAENLFHHACLWLDTIEENGGEVNESTIAALLEEIDWGENEYLQNYFRLLLDRVSRRLAQDESDGTEE